MESIESEVTDIRSAITRVRAVMGAGTWVGAAADKWATDFNSRMTVLSRLFDSFPDEERRLMAKARAQQDAKDKKSPHGA